MQTAAGRSSGARSTRRWNSNPNPSPNPNLSPDPNPNLSPTPNRTQWFDETPGTFGALVRGKRVLIIDEVDDTRATLQCAVANPHRSPSPNPTTTPDPDQVRRR